MNNALRNAISRPSLRAAVNSLDLVIDSGAAASDRPIQPGRCLDFVAASSQYIDSGVTITGGTAVDIEFTINLDSTTGGLIGCGAAGAADKGFFMQSQGGSVKITYANGTWQGNQTFQNLTLTTGVWYECRFVWDGGSSAPTLTVNDADYTTPSSIFPWVGTSADNLTFAAYEGGLTDHMDGKLGPCKYDGVLQYNNNQSSGTIAIDSSGNGNDGTLVNTPTWTTDSTLPYSWLNQTGFSERMYFDGSDDDVLMDGTAYAAKTKGTIRSYFLTTNAGSQETLCAFTDETDTDSDVRVRLNAGRAQFTVREAGTVALNVRTTNSFHDGLPHCVDIIVSDSGCTIEVDGVVEAVTYLVGSSTTVKWLADVNDIDRLGVGVRQESTPNDRFEGVIFGVTLFDEDGSTPLGTWNGYGTTDADWEDQVASNDGTVGGSPDSIYYGRDESTPANAIILDTPLQWSGSAFPIQPVDLGGNIRDLYNVAVGTTVAPETNHLSNFAAVDISTDTNYDLGTTAPIDTVFIRDSDQDRLTAYGATLTGTPLVWANNYTYGERWNDLAPWEDETFWNE
jgi:hypothetical protein